MNGGVKIVDEFLSGIYMEVFKKWILLQKNPKLSMQLSKDQKNITIKNKYSESHIVFYNQNIIELTVTNISKKEVEFYLHFQIKNIKHAVGLFNEMLHTIDTLTNKPSLKVLLCCTSGLTTGYFADKIKKVVKILNLDIHVDAISYNNLYKVGQEYDMIMLAPQISYMYAKTCEILKNQIVLNTPPAIFAKYDVKKMLSLIEKERNYKKIIPVNHHQPLNIKDIRAIGVKTLCLALIRNSKRVHIVYRLYDEENDILEDNEIIKPTLSIQDYYDVIDSMLVLYADIKVIGICTPGIIQKDRICSLGLDGLEEINIEQDFTSKYKQQFFFNNDANTIALGYYSCQEDVSSLSFIFQPVSSYAGSGHIVNHQLLLGYHHIAGEIQYLPLSYSKNVLELHQTPQGALEALTKTICGMIGFLDPELIVICCVMITDKAELKREVEKYIPKEYIPKIILIDYLQEYMLLGTLLLCHYDKV